MLTEYADKANIIKILIVEDTLSDFMISKSHLQNVPDTEYHILRGKSINEAVELLENNSFDCCLVDYHLELENGVEFVQKAMKKYGHTPFIFLTSVYERQIDDNAMKAGAIDYINKDVANSRILERSIRYAMTIKKDEAKLNESFEKASTQKEFYKNTLENSPFGIWELSNDKKSIFINSYMKELLNIEASADISNLSIENIIDGDLFNIINNNFLKTNENRHISQKFSVLDLKSNLVNDIILTKSCCSNTRYTLLTAIKIENLDELEDIHSHYFNEMDNQNNLNKISEFHARHSNNSSANFSSNNKESVNNFVESFQQSISQAKLNPQYSKSEESLLDFETRKKTIKEFA